MYGDCDPQHTAGCDLMSSCSSLNSEMSMGKILELLCILHINVLFKRQTHTHSVLNSGALCSQVHQQKHHP